MRSTLARIGAAIGRLAFSSPSLRDGLLRLLDDPTYLPARAPELMRQLKLDPARAPELTRLLRELERGGRIARLGGDRFVLPGEADLIPGRLSVNRQGRGFLAPDDASLPEIVIAREATGTALNLDHVLVRRDVVAAGHKPRGEPAHTGTVVRVLERRHTRLVGTLARSNRLFHVVPDDPRIPHDVSVPEPGSGAGQPRIGDKVVVALRRWESRRSNLEGEIVETLGSPTAPGVDMASVIRQYDLPAGFPKKVEREAQAAGRVVRRQDLAGREDCRGHPVVTIDPDDAKDFDDAFCLQREGPGRWRLWIHIADVSHYVKPGAALDEEALRRGNSCYLVDRVIPMLPEALSNELCSLRPQVDRLTKCAEFLLADDGRVLETRFHSAVIHSRRRFSYREALAALEQPPTGPVERMLHDANTLAQRIRRRRFQAGALALDHPEMKVRLDASGRVDRIEKVENDVSHQLIEEFMLLANEAVATELIRLDVPAIHRVHEEPDERRLGDYRDQVLRHGVPCGNLRQRTEVRRLLHRLDDLPLGPALKIGFLRSMTRARYAADPLGHYGLAKRHYTHFTSPIRRYADLLVHRALFEPASAPPRDALAEVAAHLSVTERQSSDAERDSRDAKMHAFLGAQLRSRRPVTYAAIVTDVRNFGFFVDVTDLGMGGLVPLSSIEDDFYVFDAARGHVMGRRSRRIIKLGDRVEVRVARLDARKKLVDFSLAGGRPRSGEAPPKRARPARPIAAPSTKPAPAEAPAPAVPDELPASEPSSSPKRKRRGRRGGRGRGKARGAT